ncbi:MAG TPA: hypothetical protein PKY59_17050 [Pyrinomonadaceae bacterium]|nr:hypothetical protein [Pyrinomonadaceae bacterium]
MDFKVFKVFVFQTTPALNLKMKRTQPFLFDEKEVDPLLKLSEVEEVLKASKVFYSVPSRPTLIEYCEDGTFESTFFRGQWFVYQSSLKNFIDSFKRPIYKAA